MSEETEKKQLNDEEVLFLKQCIHNGLTGSISFSEVIQVINNMLIQEVEERFDKMSDEESVKAYNEFKKLQADQDKAQSEQNEENSEENA